jgi:hypothetical protein
LYGIWHIEHVNLGLPSSELKEKIRNNTKWIIVCLDWLSVCYSYYNSYSSSFVWFQDIWTLMVFFQPHHHPQYFFKQFKHYFLSKIQFFS